jgi:hypothetical protein
VQRLRKENPTRGDELMKFHTLMMAVALCMVSLIAAQAGGAEARTSRHSETVTVHAAGGWSSCSDVDVRFDNGRSFRSEETTRVPGRDLSITPGEARNLGVQVIGWSGSDYEITLCRAAAEPGLLGAIGLERGSGTVAVKGPENGKWNAYLLVKAPSAARLGIETHNGPTSVRQVDGQLVIRAMNGPIRIEGVRGDVDVEAKNGPIHYRGDSGNVRLISSNGPVTIEIESSVWTGGGLEARSTNGPLSLRVPDGFLSGIAAETKGRTPYRCEADICGTVIETSDRSTRRIALGRGTEEVRISTSNGPLTISRLKGRS